VGAVPAAIQNNAFEPRYRVARFTIDSVDVPIDTVSELEELLGSAASGNLASSCSGSSCIDAGSPLGAPRWDFEGDERDASPDIGPDEYVP
jgi:hypothetical protein